MSEYLSKEEIKQWRSSLEKITLEEYAARLGKKIEEAKPTNDLIDIVLKGKPVISDADDYKQTRNPCIPDNFYLIFPVTLRRRLSLYHIDLVSPQTQLILIQQ